MRIWGTHCTLGLALVGVLTSLAAAGGPYSIELEQVVAEGVPGPGAGVIDVPGDVDVYELVVDAETTVFFDELAGSCVIRWRAEDESGGTIFDDIGMCVTDPGVYTLTPGQTYSIECFGFGAATGPYSFVVRNVDPPQQFLIGLEEVIADGAPAPGAGNIEGPGSIDLYDFDVPPGTAVFFDALGGSCGLRWSCTDANGDVVFEDALLCSTDPGTIELVTGGTYTMQVSGLGDTTSTYSFTLWSVEPPQAFVIGIEEIIAEDMPGPGAGNLEEPGAIDFYTFEARPDQDLYFDELDGPCGVRWRCTDESGALIFDDQAFCSTDPGVYTLEGGTHTIEVYGAGDNFGTYSFTIWTVEPPDVFSIKLGQVVSDGDPGPGAGNLEEPGSIDFYTFEAPAGLSVFFDELNGPCSVRWTCTDANGAQVFDDLAMCSTDPGEIVLATGGTYTIEVYGAGGATGVYSFTVGYILPPELFDIELEEVVAPDAPGPGAGNIERPGSVDIYSLFVPEDDVVCVNEIYGPCSVQWTCVGPDGEELFFDPVFCAFNPGTFFFEGGATYTFTVFGLSDATGEYSFVVQSGSLADFTGDCVVDVSDLIILFGAWARPTPMSTETARRT